MSRDCDGGTTWGNAEQKVVRNQPKATTNIIIASLASKNPSSSHTSGFFLVLGGPVIQNPHFQCFFVA